MISEILGLAGSSVLGSSFQFVSDWQKGRRDIEHDKLLLEIKREDARNKVVADYTKHFRETPAYGQGVRLIILTYCLCCILCIMFPSVPLETFNPEDTPRKFSFLGGLFSYEWQTTKIYVITTGGVGYSLLHPLAFIIGRVVTGVKEI